MHSVHCTPKLLCIARGPKKKWSGKEIFASWKTIRAGRNIFRPIKTSLTSLNNTNHVKIIIYVSDKRQNIAKIAKNCKVAKL